MAARTPNPYDTTPLTEPGPHTNGEWLNSDEFAYAIGCSVKMVRYHTRRGILQAFPDRIARTSQYWFHHSLLGEELIYAVLTGTTNRKRWGSGWQGSHLTNRQLRRQVNQAHHRRPGNTS